MTLNSGDMISFSITTLGMTLKAVSYSNREQDDGDTVQLSGHDVALLLYRLKTDTDGCVMVGGPNSSMLRTQSRYDYESSKLTVALETDDNVVVMKAYERDMFVAAIESQAWRLFH